MVYVARQTLTAARILSCGYYRFLKKLAILKWGSQESRYFEYKKGLLQFIKEDFDDPKFGHEAPLYQQGFDQLIHHLENEPNPFSIDEA